jgi:hypothetical protein
MSQYSDNAPVVGAAKRAFDAEPGKFAHLGDSIDQKRAKLTVSVEPLQTNAAAHHPSNTQSMVLLTGSDKLFVIADLNLYCIKNSDAIETPFLISVQWRSSMTNLYCIFFN